MPLYTKMYGDQEQFFSLTVENVMSFMIFQRTGNLSNSNF